MSELRKVSRSMVGRGMQNSDCTGSILVEMAFALPIMAIIFLCIVDLGLIVREYQLLQNAVREGARFSARPINQIYFSSNPCATQSAIKQYVIDYAAQEDISITASNITVNQVYPIPGGSGSEITASYQRSKLLLGAPYLGMGPLTLKGRSVFSNLYGAAPTTLPTGTTCP